MNLFPIIFLFIFASPSSAQDSFSADQPSAIVPTVPANETGSSQGQDTKQKQSTAESFQSDSALRSPSQPIAPFSSSVSTSADTPGNKNLTVKGIDENGDGDVDVLEVDWNNRTSRQSNFSVDDNNHIQARFNFIPPAVSNGEETLDVELDENQVLISGRRELKYATGQLDTTDMAFTEKGLLKSLTVDSNVPSNGYTSHSTWLYDYVELQAGIRLESSVSTTSWSSTSSGNSETSKSKIFMAYSADGTLFASARTSEANSNGVINNEASFYLADAAQFQITSATIANQIPQQVQDKIDTLIQHTANESSKAAIEDLIARFATYKTVWYYTDASLSKGRFSIESSRDEQDQLVARKVLRSGSSLVEIVVGEPDVLSGETNDIKFQNSQSVSGYTVTYGPVYAYQSGKRTYVGYGLAFSKRISGRQVIVVVDYPRVKTVKLNGINYRITINKSGKISLARI